MDIEVKLICEEVFSSSTEELDFVLQDRFLTQKEKDANDNGDGYFYADTQYMKGSYVDGVPAPIEMIKELIEKAEKAGANYIFIDYHCDHIEFALMT